MRRVVVLLVTLALATGVGPAQGATPKRTLSGTVTSGVDGSPLAGIEVCARTTQADDGTCAVSDTDGRYRLSVRQGRQHVLAEEPGRYGSWVTQGWPGRTVTVGSSGATSGVVMRPGARATLYLTSAAAAISPTMSVAAYRLDAQGQVSTQEVTFSNLGVRATDDHVAYADVAKLPAGRYVLRLEWNDDGGSHAQAWYPGVATADEAEVVELDEGEEVRLPTMELQPPATLTVTARHPDGSAATIDEVVLVDGTGRVVPGWLHHAVAPSRTIRFLGLPAGRYRARLEENTRTLRYRQWVPDATGSRTPGWADVAVGSSAQIRATLRYRTPKRVSPPKTKHRGYSVSVTTMPRFSPTPTRQQIRWYRDGRRTDAIGRNYSVERRDVGHRLQACVTATRTGWGRVLFCSKPYRPKDTWRE